MDAIDIMLLTGEWMLRVLFLILIARPVARVFKFRYLVKYRRQMGWVFGLLTVAHLAVYVFLYIDSWKFLLTLYDDVWFITGAIATLISLALTATSNNWAVRKLRKNWRYLHMTTYPLGFLGILHGEIASKQVNLELYFMLTAYALLILWRYRTLPVFLLTAVAIGISFVQVTPKSPTIHVEPEVVEADPIADELCGQYGYNYYESEDGLFYNCIRIDHDIQR